MPIELELIGVPFISLLSAWHTKNSSQKGTVKKTQFQVFFFLSLDAIVIDSDTWYDLTCFKRASEHIVKSPLILCHLAYKPQISALPSFRTTYIRKRNTQYKISNEKINLT